MSIFINLINKKDECKAFPEMVEILSYINYTSSWVFFNNSESIILNNQSDTYFIFNL